MSKNKQLNLLQSARYVSALAIIISAMISFNLIHIEMLDTNIKRLTVLIFCILIHFKLTKKLNKEKQKLVNIVNDNSNSNEEQNDDMNDIMNQIREQLKNAGLKEITFTKDIATANLSSEDEEDTKLEIPEVKFKDVIGLKEAKEELKTLVDFLKEPEKYEKAGAKLLKAVLLYGPPGTGKTTLAKALAGEAEVGFIYKTGSSFTNKYVGVGPQNIRKMFEEANKKAPCIVFIDEIECLGRSRSGSENSEDLKTLDEFLSRLDGFVPNKGVLVVGATNKPDYLDEAFTRPGRFDSKISVPIPQTKEERLDIIKYFSKNKCLYDTVDLDRLAKETIGCSPAAIESVLNKAAIKQVASNEKAITDVMIEEAFTEYLMEGHLEKDRNNSKKEKELKTIAYHESGHTLIGKLLDRDVCKVTIVGTTSGAGGFTRTIPEETGLLSKRDLKNQIMELYGGRAAEEIYFNDKEKITTGCSNDIERASKLIRLMIRRYGMGEENGLLVTESAEEIKRCFEEEKKLSNSLYNETVKMLRENRETLDNLAEALLEKETLIEEEIQEIVLKTRIAKTEVNTN